jgi:hypothetical protein
VTITETLTSVAIAVVVLAVLAPVLAQTGITGATTTSRDNLRTLGAALDCYAADWSGRQFTAVPDDLGVVGGDCDQYGHDYGCYPPLIIGWTCEPPIGLWSFPVDCAYDHRGWCFNKPVTIPIDFDGSNVGVFRLANVRAVHDYLSGRVLDPVYYAPLDAETYDAAAPFFGVDCEYADRNNLVPPSYVLSPAAMYHPDVLRAPSRGGFQPPDTLAHGYESPAVSQAAFPGLKTRLIEHHWIEKAPPSHNPNYQDPLHYFYDNDGRFPYLFNQGLGARPLAAMFDGSVGRLPTADVWLDDMIVMTGSGGVDGLWSRDTPFGAIGYQGASTYDRRFTSHHVLTTDGIRGRDRLDDASIGRMR